MIAYLILSSDYGSLIHFYAVNSTRNEELIKELELISRRWCSCRSWTIRSNMSRKGILPSNLITNLLTCIRNGYMWNRIFISNPHSKLTTTAVNISIFQRYLQGVCFIPPESICYTHIFRSDRNYHVETSFVSTHRILSLMILWLSLLIPSFTNHILQATKI